MYRNTFTDYNINVHIFWEKQVNRNVFYVRNVIEFCSKRKHHFLFADIWHYNSIILSYMMYSLSSALITSQE